MGPTKRTLPHSPPMRNDDPALVLLRGGGDLASGVALRLHRAGVGVVMAELEEPLAVRRAVSFAEAIYEGQHTVEGVRARRSDPDQIPAVLAAGEIPVLVDPTASVLHSALPFPVVVDARLIKAPPDPLPVQVPLHVGLGPGFQAGVNCHAVVETRRSHTLGRLYWEGATQPDSGQPEGDLRRVLRAPASGRLLPKAEIGDHVEEGQVLALIGDQHPVISALNGVLRGIAREGLQVTRGMKIGDVDPRNDREACFLVSDKALAIGGAVLEAILTNEEIRGKLWR